MINKMCLKHSKREIIEVINNSEINKPIRDIDIVEFNSGQGILGNLYEIDVLEPENYPEDIQLLYKNQCCSDKHRESNVYDLLGVDFKELIPKKICSFDSGDFIVEKLYKHQSGSIINGCTITEARLIISSIAKIHSYFWGNEDIPRDSETDFAGILQYNLDQNWEFYRSRYSAKMGKVIDDFEWLINNTDITSNILYKGKTLTHGDLHLENIMFTSTGDIRVIDWQLASKRTPAFDISFFIIQNLDKEVRKKYEQELLVVYYSSLSEEVKKEYSFSLFLLEYRACLTRTMMTSVMMIGERFSHKKNQMANADIMAERVFSSIKDHKPIEAINELLEIDKS